MQIGMVGLGRMGAKMVRRLMRGGHECVVYDVDASAVDALAAEGATPAKTLAELAAALRPPRAVWVMVPAGVTEQTVTALADVFESDDIIVDGGNSYFHDDVRRAEALRPLGIHYVDCGTSGGVWGEERGYCLMIGGEPGPVQHLGPVFATIAPGLDAAPRTPGRDEATPSTAELGYLHCGPNGAGHFVKMVHNGIEYGIMAAYAEGFDLLHNANQSAREGVGGDAETTPLHDTFLRYDIDTREVAELWRRGSVVGSWLLDLTAIALQDDPALAQFGGRVSDSGEGRWTVEAAVEAGVPANVLAAALFARFTSRGNAAFGDKLLSAMRYQFGGHEEKKA